MRRLLPLFVAALITSALYLIAQTVNPPFPSPSSGGVSGSGTSGMGARWTGTTSLGTGMIFDDGTKVGVGGASEAPYAFQVVGNTTGGLFAGIANHDTSNVGNANLCFLVNEAASFTCLYQLGSAAGSDPGTFNMSGGGDYIFRNSGNTEEFRVYNGGGIKLASMTPPTCDSGHGGTFAYQHTNVTTKDNVEVCAQDASGVWAWRTIY